jgi:hypothetical protein
MKRLLCRLLGTASAVALGVMSAAAGAIERPAMHGGGGGRSKLCTYTYDLTNDGCLASPGGQMQDKAYFTQWRQSGQSFVATPGFSQTSSEHPPPYNVPGADYPLGNVTPVASMSDPRIAMLPAGCTFYPFSPTTPFTGGNPPKSWDPTLGNGYPAMVRCLATSAPITLAHYNFGPVNGHGCTYLYPDEHSTYDLTIQDNYWELTAECSTYNLAGGAGGHNSLIGTDAVYNVNINFISNTIIGHAYDPCCKYAGVGNQSAPPYTKTASMFGVNLNSHKTVTIEYNWVQEFPGQPFAVSGKAVVGSTAIMKWNYVRDFQVRTPQGHGEFANVCCLSNLTQDYNTFVGTKNVGAVWDAVMNMGNSNGGFTTSNVEIIGNTAIVNGVGGATSAQLFPKLRGHMASGVYTVDTVSTKVYPGANLNAGATWGPVELNELLSGDGTAGSTFSINCGVSGRTTGCPSSIGSSYLAQTPLDGSTIIQSAGQASNAIANQFIDMGHGTYINIIIQNNYVDVSHLLKGPFVRAGRDVICTTPTSFAGNINMNTGASISGWANAGSSGC